MTSKGEQVIRDVAAGLDLSVKLMWEEKGPENTVIETHSMWMINGKLFYLQIFDRDCGFEIFSPTCQTNSTIDLMKAMHRIITQ